MHEIVYGGLAALSAGVLLLGWVARSNKLPELPIERKRRAWGSGPQPPLFRSVIDRDGRTIVSREAADERDIREIARFYSNPADMTAGRETMIRAAKRLQAMRTDMERGRR